MNRQQKRSTLFKLSKDIKKYKRGEMTVAEIQTMNRRIKELQREGVLLKRPGFFKRLWKKIFG